MISVAYRGKQIGHVVSDYGRIKARASSYVNATLELTDVCVFSDLIPLIEDLTRGSITFDTVTQIGGELGLFLFDIPIKVYSFSSQFPLHNLVISFSIIFWDFGFSLASVYT